MEDISEKFYTTVSGILPLSLSESETESYPYAVFTHEPVTSWTKEGPYKIDSELVCDFYGKDFDGTLELADKAVTSVTEDMNDGTFAAWLYRSEKACTEGIWDIRLTFKIRQNL